MQYVSIHCRIYYHKLREHKPELQRKYPVARLGVFGSYARGEATEKSDIDIAVEIIGLMGLSFVAMLR